MAAAEPLEHLLLPPVASPHQQPQESNSSRRAHPSVPEQAATHHSQQQLQAGPLAPRPHSRRYATAQLRALSGERWRLGALRPSAGPAPPPERRSETGRDGAPPGRSGAALQGLRAAGVVRRGLP